MRGVKDLFKGMENTIKIKSRKGYQTLTRSISRLRYRMGNRPRSGVRKSSRS